MLIRELLSEGRAQEIVHKNPTVGALKALAKNNKYGSVRFVIYKDGTLVAGDSELFTHHSMAPAMGAWDVRGYVQHLDNDEYAYRSMNIYDPTTKDHPIFRRWEKMGIENGNVTSISLNEKVGVGYLYHATGTDINDLKSILTNGLRGNNTNTHRTGSILNAVSFTRNWRYALTSRDDDNQETSGIANGVILVVDPSILRQKYKMKSVDRPADSPNSLKSILNSITTVSKAQELYSLADQISLEDGDKEALSKIAQTPVTGSRQFILSITKPYFADKANNQALELARTKIKQAINYFAKTSKSKSLATGKVGSTASEYEEVALTKQPLIPFRDLGVVGYMINAAVDSDQQQLIRTLFKQARVPEMPIPNATRPRETQISENFADGKGPGRPGDSQRHGIPKKATMAELEKAAKAKGRKGQLARWQINMRRGKKKVSEDSDDRKQMIADFVKFALDQLKCDHKPRIKLVTDNNTVQDFKSFGGTNIHTGEIRVYIKNRNLADCLRTLCHELVHYKQFKDGRIKGPEDGKTGSELENEANAKAGIILRHYGKMKPAIFESK